MGYYKQQQVANETMLPAPKPAIEHAVFFPNRKLRRLSERRASLPASVVVFTAMVAMFVLGVVLGVMA